MKGYCPNCNKECDIEKLNVTETVTVRGEKIDVGVEYFKCNGCGIEFEDMNSDVKPVEMAYKKYRTVHNMVTPEDIIEMRNRYSLTQKELSLILGWGGATLSRYENGSLQDEAHDRMLRLVMNPANLLDLVERHSDTISVKKRDRLIEKITEEIQTAHQGDLIFNALSRINKPDVFSGFAKLHFGKLKNALLFFCEGGIYKTIINKLLFYADFKFYKEQGVGITGARYAHLPYGPVIDNYEHILAILVESDESIELEERQLDDGGKYVGLFYCSIETPDMDIFSVKEKETMLFVRKYFRNFGSKEISDFSHNEKGYKKTSNGEHISYEYAQALQI